MSPQTGSIVDRIQDHAATDADFRARLKSDPRAAIEAATGARLPEGLSVRVVEQSPEEVYIVLPPVEGDARELTESELDQVAGAGCGWCMFTKGTWCWFTK